MVNSTQSGRPSTPVEHSEEAGAVGGAGAVSVVCVSNVSKGTQTTEGELPSAEALAAAALSFANRLENNDYNNKFQEVRGCISNGGTSVSRMPPAAARELLEKIEALGPDIPVWLKNQIANVRSILEERAAIQQIEYEDGSYIGHRGEINYINQMLTKQQSSLINFQARKFVVYASKILSGCSEVSKQILNQWMTQLDARFKFTDIDRDMEAWRRGAVNFSEKSEDDQKAILERDPSSLLMGELCGHAYILAASRAENKIIEAKFAELWSPVLSALDSNGLTDWMRYAVAAYYYLNLSDLGLTASLTRAPNISLKDILLTKARLRFATDEIDFDEGDEGGNGVEVG